MVNCVDRVNSIVIYTETGPRMHPRGYSANSMSKLGKCTQIDGTSRTQIDSTSRNVSANRPFSSKYIRKTLYTCIMCVTIIHVYINYLYRVGNLNGICRQCSLKESCIAKLAKANY